MARIEKDRFDEQPATLERVGAHRAPKRKGQGWIGFAWAALATGLLVLVGLFAMSRIDDSISFEFPVFAGDSTAGPTPTPVPTADPVTDPTTIDPARGILITILNGTATTGLQNTVGDQLSAAAWPIGARTQASQQDVEKTYVYYSNPADEDIARGLVAALGVGDIRLSDAFPGAPVTVVLGADYTGETPTS